MTSYGVGWDEGIKHKYRTSIPATGRQVNSVTECSGLPTKFRSAADFQWVVKQQAIASFFSIIKKRPGEVEPTDVKRWQHEMERKPLARSTIYNRISFLSSFYLLAMRDPQCVQSIGSDPAIRARPKSPRAYQTDATKALSDKELSALIEVVGSKAASGDIVGKRDYALLLFYVMTGMRRSEVIHLRGKDLTSLTLSMLPSSRSPVK